MIAADMKANNGLITLEDLKNYVAKKGNLIRGTYRGHEIISMSPPSSGGLVLMQTLKMLEPFDIRSMGHNSAAKYHLQHIEASRRAFADRAEYMGDADFANVPIKGLLDEKYIASRRATIDQKKSTPSTEIRFGAPAGAEGNDTTHYTVVDPEGNIVSNTYTINDLYGSRVTIKGTGILMNDEMDDFAARPGMPNMYGLIQGERNKVEGGKRPLSAMTPTIVLKGWFSMVRRWSKRRAKDNFRSIANGD